MHVFKLYRIIRKVFNSKILGDLLYVHGQLIEKLRISIYCNKFDKRGASHAGPNDFPRNWYRLFFKVLITREILPDRSSIREVILGGWSLRSFRTM